jgi:hypothetical protein
MSVQEALKVLKRGTVEILPEEDLVRKLERLFGSFRHNQVVHTLKDFLEPELRAELIRPMFASQGTTFNPVP